MRETHPCSKERTMDTEGKYIPVRSSSQRWKTLDIHGWELDIFLDNNWLFEIWLLSPARWLLSQSLMHQFPSQMQFGLTADVILDGYSYTHWTPSVYWKLRAPRSDCTHLVLTYMGPWVSFFGLINGFNIKPNLQTS